MTYFQASLARINYLIYTDGTKNVPLKRKIFLPHRDYEKKSITDFGTFNKIGNGLM